MKKKTIRTHRRAKDGFNPSSIFIQQAVDEYLNDGGKIEILKVGEEDYRGFLSKTNDSSAHDFLTEG